MIYSSGNHRRGTGRTVQRSKKQVVSVPYTEETAHTHLNQLRHQVEFAQSAGLNVAPYEMKIAEILGEFPQLAQ